MKPFRLIGVALLAVLALSAIAASSAQAVSPAPFFTVNGARLAAGHTHNIAAKKKSTTFVLSVPEFGVSVTCTKVTVEKGVLLGSNEGEPGKDNEITAFSGCEVSGDGSPCAVAEPITTSPLISEQVENVVSGTGGKQLLEEFFPASGSTFVTLTFSGTGCTPVVGAQAVSGQVAAEVLLDNAAQGKIELGQTAEQAVSWVLKFPGAESTEVWLITNGVGKIAKVKLTTGGSLSTLTGETLQLLANTKGEPEYTLWSPLP